MKKLILAVITVTIISASCKKDKSPSPTTTPSTTPTPLVLTAADSALLGNWILDRKDDISNGVMLSGYPQYFSDPVNCRIEFKATPYLGSNNQNWKECSDGIKMTGYIEPYYWKMTSATTIEVSGQIYIIVSQSLTNMALQWGSTTSPGTEGFLYYLHK